MFAGCLRRGGDPVPLLEPELWDALLLSEAAGEMQPVMTLGPYGQRAAGIKDLLELLGPAERLHLKRQNYTAVVCMQGLQDVRNDWSRLQVAGIRDTFDKLGIRLLAVTDGEFEIDKQIADYRHVTMLQPDVLLTLPLDRQRSAPALREAREQGIQLVFIDSVPAGMEHPRDYGCMVMADSYANGQHAARLLIDHLNGSGTVALLHWENSMLTCDERSRAARDTFAASPGIRVVTERQFRGIYDVKPLVEELLAEYPDLCCSSLYCGICWGTPSSSRLTKRRPG